MKGEALKKFEKTPCFTKAALKQLHKGSELSLDKDIQNWLKKGTLIQLKRGLYTLQNFIYKEKNLELFTEYAANKLVQPSYVSCEYIMQKHGLLTEAIFGITSVTLKSSRGFQNKIGSFKFYSISEQLFGGYISRPYGDNMILEATKAKAFFDYIYLRQHMFRNFTKKEVDEIRINFEELTKKDWQELKKYFKLCKGGKPLKIFNCLQIFSR